MDPHVEGKPPSATIAEVDVEVEREPPAPIPVPIDAPSASSIFRTAFARPEESISPSRSVDSDAERKRQEEEFLRKLRGEYEAAQRRLGDVINDNLSRPMRLSSIRLSPAPPTTRSGFLNSLLSPFISPPPAYLPSALSFLHPAPPPPQTLQEILMTTKALIAHIDQYGVFDTARTDIRLESALNGNEDDVELVLGLKERGRVFLKAGTEVGGGEGGGNVTARIRNALGGAETLELNASLGTKTKSAYQASLTTPILASPLLSFALQAFSFDRDNTAFASHREAAQGGRAKVSAICPWGTHDLSYEYVMRDINHLSPGASVSIRDLARASSKASIIHTWTSDTRNDLWTATAGRLLKLSHEVAGLPGSSEDVKYVKTTAQSQISRPIWEGSSTFVSISSLSTLLFPLLASPTPLPDRTYLGGPNSLRGWKVSGAGLRDGQDSLGGDMSWAVGASVLTPIPFKEHWRVKLHGFLNTGKVCGYERDRTFTENITKMYTRPNVSVGLGLVYRLEPVRIEVNFAMPLVARKGERLARGFGVGVGIEFL